jgi:uncharacterized protein (TIGR03066 family)
MSLTLLLACSLTLLSAADEPATNRDKLVGRWECNQLPGLPRDAKAALRLTFTQDGKLTLVLETPGVSKVVTGTWKMGAGDRITLSDLSEPLGNRRTHEQSVTIKGEELTLKDSDGTIAVFKRM